MKILKFRVSFCLSFTLLIILFSQIVSAQGKLIGEITITGGGGADNFVTVNGERVISGRTIMSPADISTSAQTSAKITLPKTGTILVAPNSKIKLFFVNGGISGDVLAGEVTFNTEAGTGLNILTADGTTTLANKNQTNIVKIMVNNSATKIYTLFGTAVFNTVTVNAGEYFPTQTNDASTTPKKSGNKNGLIFIALIGAAVAAVVLGLASKGGDDSSPASPVR